MALMKWINSAVIRDNSLFCLPGNGRNLYKISLKNFSIERKIEISKQASRYWSLFAKNNDFFCVSKSGGEIICWNENTDETFTLRCATKIPEHSEVVGYKDIIWMMPKKVTDDLFYYSIDKKKYYISENWKKFIKNSRITGRIKRWYNKDNYVYLIIEDERKILKFDMDIEQLTDITIPIDGYVEDLAVHEDKIYFLVDKDTSVHCWKLQSEFVTDIENTMQESCHKLVDVGDAIVIDGVHSVGLLRNGKICKTDIKIKKGSARAAFVKAIKYKTFWLVMPWGNDAFITFSENFDSYSINRLSMPIEDLIDAETILDEGDVSLKEWLQYLTEKET